jgi:hypothetical protein
MPAATSTQTADTYDLIVRNGTLYDGTGTPGRRADVGIRGDRVASIGDLSRAQATTEIDATGQAVAPGFINVLSWANLSLIADGRGMSDLKQGVTLEIMGEGESGGPLNDAMKADILQHQGDIRYEIDWTTLGEYLDSLVRRGISPNVASFVGATSVRVHVLGEDDRDPTPAELVRMQDLVRQAMREGALGVGSSLIYAPAFFAETPELIALAQAAAESGGGYVSHVRNESHRLEAAIGELIEITRAAGGHGEAYHLKAAGEANWGNMARAIAKIEEARRQGVAVSANMYTYTAGSTGFDAAMPLWVQAVGLDAWVARLKDPQQRARVIGEIRNPPAGEEPLPHGRLAGSRAARRLQEPSAQAAHRQDARGRDEDARHERRRHDRGSRDRGQLTRAGDLFPDERGQREARTVAAVGQSRFRCRGAGAGRRVHEVEHPPARLWQFRAPAGQVFARREADAAGGSHPAHHATAGDQLEVAGPRLSRRELLCGRRRLRSSNCCGHGDLRLAEAVRRRC